MPDLTAIVAEIAEEMQAAPDRGRPADYIPPLARVDPGQFGMAVVTADGVFTGGSADALFSLQSVSKVFALTLALGRPATSCGTGSAASPPAVPSTPSSSWNPNTASRAIPSSTPGPSSSRM